MKKILFIAATILALGAKAQSYPLKSLVISDTANYLTWEMVNYPSTNVVKWSLNVDSTDGVIKSGYYNLPDSLINVWGTDDNIIPKYLIKIKVWGIKQQIIE